MRRRLNKLGHGLIGTGSLVQTYCRLTQHLTLTAINLNLY